MCSIGVYLNIAKGEILPGQTHMESTLFLQVMEDAKVVTDGNGFISPPNVNFSKNPFNKI